MTFLDLPVILPQIKAGLLRPIALGAPERAPTAPDVPTTAEVGMPDLLIENWYGMIAPAGTPEKLVATLNRVANEAMNDPSVKQNSPSRASRWPAIRRSSFATSSKPKSKSGPSDQGFRRPDRKIKLR